jgi:hypothetical protein
VIFSINAPFADSSAIDHSYKDFGAPDHKPNKKDRSSKANGPIFHLK